MNFYTKHLLNIVYWTIFNLFHYGLLSSILNIFIGKYLLSFSDADIPDPTWSSWEEWSECSVSCGDSGTRFRNRVCQVPQHKRRHLDCEVMILDYRLEYHSNRILRI